MHIRKKEISVQMQFTPFSFYLWKTNRAYDAVDEKSSSSFCTRLALLQNTQNNSSVCVLSTERGAKKWNWKFHKCTHHGNENDVGAVQSLWWFSAAAAIQFNIVRHRFIFMKLKPHVQHLATIIQITVSIFDCCKQQQEKINQCVWPAPAPALVLVLPRLIMAFIFNRFLLCHGWEIYFE